ncbi:MAG: hypothetical protein N3B10_11350 [Armatimonadetes bacterium]|nr:hypothetical protein [Armatimonadota bacterium]
MDTKHQQLKNEHLFWEGETPAEPKNGCYSIGTYMVQIFCLSYDHRTQGETLHVGSFVTLEFKRLSCRFVFKGLKSGAGCGGVETEGEATTRAQKSYTLRIGAAKDATTQLGE